MSTGKPLPTVEATISGDFDRIMNWADQYRVLRVRTNADTPADARQAVKFGDRASAFAARSICFLLPTGYRPSGK